VPRGVAPRHEGQLQLVDARTRKRKADQPPTVSGHEVDRGRGCHLRRDDQITFVLAIFVVDQDEHSPVAGVFNDVLDARQLRRSVQKLTRDR
jgi:hypothetical protein